MKKLWALICILMFVFPVSIASAACAHENWTGVGDAGAYYEYAQFTDTHHWRTVTFEFICLDCGYSYWEQWNTDYFPHEFAGDTCTLCGYTRGQVIVCTHGGWCDGEYWDAYEKYSDTKHIKITNVDWKCLSCGDEWTEEKSRVQEAHEFSGNKCTLCGYNRSSDAGSSKEPSKENLQDAARMLGDQVVGATAKIAYAGNLRAKPSTEAEIIGKVYVDETYQIMNYELAHNGNVWLEIEYDQMRAWMSASLAQIITYELDTTDATTYLIGRKVIVTIRSGHARSAPGTDSNKVDSIVRGQEYTILDYDYDSIGKLWYKIRIGSVECWIASGLVDVQW